MDESGAALWMTIGRCGADLHPHPNLSLPHTSCKLHDLCAERPNLLGSSLKPSVLCAFGCLQRSLPLMLLGHGPPHCVRPKRSFSHWFNVHLFPFSPFFRSELMIITPKDKSQFWKENMEAVSGSSLWGPVLRLEVLHEVRFCPRSQMVIISSLVCNGSLLIPSNF